MLTLLMLACETATPEPEVVADPCPEIGLDALANDWVKVSGSAADHKYRLRIFQEGEAWKAWYIGGGFTHREMAGELRSKDLKLTEVPTGAKKEAFEAGTDTLTRLYFEPKDQKCVNQVVEVNVALVDGKEKETQVTSGYVEWLPFPKQAGVEFTYQPCDETAFVDKAAKDWKVAQKELAMEGGVNPVASLGEAVPVAAWSTAADDGDAACTYDMDVYFDDRPVEGAGPIAAELKGEQRHWYHEFRAPYSGPHHFELYRHRTCEGGERELIAVTCIEAILD